MSTNENHPETENTVSNSDENKTWQFQPGVSGNPAGKPKGATHKVTRASMAMLDGELETLTRKCIDMALDGDMAAMKLCMDRLVPPLKATLPSVMIDLEGAETLEEMAKVFVKAAASGEISPDIAAHLVSAVTTAARIGNVTMEEERLEAFEQDKKLSEMTMDELDALYRKSQIAERINLEGPTL
ncbi:MAG: hypothetical protein GY761_12255 [Hyphomicrobiales bacterium]|nr:hypothetical protein [Hyphomicrobiales bacterium]